MAIQTINLAVPGGDTPRSANTKINANFADPTNAASKLVGKGAGQVPLSEQVFEVFSTAAPQILVETDLDTLEAGSYVWLSGYSSTNAPKSGRAHVQTHGGKDKHRHQIFFSFEGGDNFELWMRQEDRNKIWGRWRALTENTSTYSTTTANGANVVVDNTGTLMRSTSSERYKDILAPLELDDARYADAMALKPIVYRSTADADNPAYHYYSFSAEELGAYDPAFTLWRDTETVTDEDGNVTEQPFAERQAEGININALLAMSHAIAIKQGELIKDLQDQVIEQKEAIAALQQTNP